MDKYIISFISNLDPDEVIACHYVYQFHQMRDFNLNKCKAKVDTQIKMLPSYDPEEVIKGYNLTVVKKPDYQNISWILRSSVSFSRKIVEVFQYETVILMEALQYFPHIRAKITEDMMDNIVLWHEVYHLMNNDKDDYNTHEIRANLFSQKIMKLDFYPWLLDLIQLCYRTPSIAEYLDRRLHGYWGFLKARAF